MTILETIVIGTFLAIYVLVIGAASVIVAVVDQLEKDRSNRIKQKEKP